MAGQYKFKDTNGNVVSSISGSNTGVISFSGSLVDFSNTIISGTISNSNTVNGLSSSAFVFTSSFNTISSSVSSQLTTLQTTSGSNIGRLNNLESKSSSVDISISNINNVTSSFSPRVSNLESKSASVDISISNINSFTASNGNTSLNSYTASNDTKFTTLGSYTGSNDTKWTSISNVTSSLIQVTGSYATTGSNTFKGTQIVSASMYVQGDLVVYGSSSIQYISASSVSIGTNIVQLNTNQPAVRFGGLSVQDSGSAVGVTGSMFWDGCCNRWIYSNPSGVGYSGGVLMSGPRGSTLGNEPTLTCNYIAKSGGGDHLYDSCIWELSGSVGINCSSPGFNLDVNGTSGFNSNVLSGPAAAITATQNGTGYLFVGKCGASNRFRVGPTGYVIVDENSNNTGLIINQSGGGYSAIFCGGNVGIGITNPSTNLDINSTAGLGGWTGIRLKTGTSSVQSLSMGQVTAGNGAWIGMAQYNQGGYWQTEGTAAAVLNFESDGVFRISTNSDLTANTNYNITERLRITSGGNVGINCITPNYKLHVNGCTAIDGNLRMGSGYSSGNSTDPGITVQGYSNAGVYFTSCGVGLGGGSSTNLLFLSCLGNVSIGTESAYGKLSVVSSDDTVLSSAVWGGALAGGIHATIYNNSQCVNSVAGLKLITRNSGASHWSMYNISTGASTGDLIFGHGSGGSGCERLRIVSSGNIGINNTTPCGKLQITLGIVAGGCFRTSAGGEAALTIEACSNSYIQFMNCSNAQTGFMFGNNCTAYSGMIWYRHDQKQLMLGAGGTETMYICGGKVGIGCSTPGYKLDVCGQLNVGGDSTINRWSSDSWGKFLQIDVGFQDSGGGIVFTKQSGAGDQSRGILVNHGNLYIGRSYANDTSCAAIYDLTISAAGAACFAQIPSFPGATLTCTYTCTYSSYTAGCWLGLFAGDNGYNGAYAFTVVGQFNLGGSAMYSINFATVPYIHKSSSINATNGNDIYGIAHTSSGHADNGALVCFRRARYNSNTPAGNRTEMCMNVSYSTSFTATTYVLAWV